MNIPRYIGASIAVFLANQITDPVIHGVILGKTYEQLNHIWRPDMMSKMWIMVLASIVFACLFVYIFARIYEKKGIAEGVRYGIFIGVFMNVIAIMQQYVVYPVPVSLALQWSVFGMMQYVLYGVITALIYKPKYAA